jgi:hypothetical protein
MYGIILATERPKEDSRKQFVTIYFVGESTSLGTTTTYSFTLATYIPDTRACITFGNGNGSLYATTICDNNICGSVSFKKKETQKERGKQKGTFSFLSCLFISLHGTNPKP